MQSFKIIVEKHQEGYIAYPLGLKGVVVGEGDTYEDAVADATSAIEFHTKTFGTETFEILNLSKQFSRELKEGVSHDRDA